MDLLDTIDKNILYELDRNSRQAVSELAKTIGQSRERTTYRIKKLEESGIIKKYTIAINPYKVGFVVYKTYVRLSNNRKRIDQLLAVLKKHPRVYWYAEAYGTWDMLFAVFGRNPKDFDTIQKEIISKFSDIITNYSVYAIVEGGVYSKGYLRGIGNDAMEIGGEPIPDQLERVDLNILDSLYHNARLSVVDIAESQSISPHLVRSHLKKLEEMGVIVGYRVELDLQKLGILSFKAQLHRSNYDLRGEQELIEYCRGNPHVVLYIEQIGDCKTELEFEVDQYEQFHGFVDQLREKFARYIRRVDSIMYRKEFYKGVPLDIVKD